MTDIIFMVAAAGLKTRDKRFFKLPEDEKIWRMGWITNTRSGREMIAGQIDLLANQQAAMPLQQALTRSACAGSVPATA
jgi:hypothetical protein